MQQNQFTGLDRVDALSGDAIAMISATGIAGLSAIK
jgi:hypothetical protein